MERTSDPAAGLREQVARLRAGPGRPAVEMGPASAYEAVTRQMVEGLGEELREIKSRLNGLVFMVAGAIVVDVVLRVAGSGRGVGARRGWCRRGSRAPCRPGFKTPG